MGGKKKSSKAHKPTVALSQPLKHINKHLALHDIHNLKVCGVKYGFVNNGIRRLVWPLLLGIGDSDVAMLKGFHSE
jgi:hypothetical protein